MVVMAAQELSFAWTGWTLLFGSVLVIATAVLGWVAWRRVQFAHRTGFLEALRLVIVALVVLTLAQPELQEPHAPQQQPTLVILADESGSMQTRDAIVEHLPGQEPITREDQIAPWLQESVWESVSEEMDVVVQPFSSDLEDPVTATDLGTALARTVAEHENLRAVVLLSDGDWNLGDAPVHAALRLRAEGVPVFTVAAGSESRLPDVEITRFSVPTFSVAGKPVRIPFVISSALPHDYRATVTLTSDSGDHVTRDVTIPAMSVVEDAIFWRPADPGNRTLELTVPVHEDELVRNNNVREARTVIRDEALRVLLVESTPRWEYRYLRNALQRDPGVEVSCLLFHPRLDAVGGGADAIPGFPGTLEELSRFDVVFLGDVGVEEGQLTAEDCRLLTGLVRSQASGLILMPGHSGRHFSLVDTELGELYPVELDPTQPKGWGTRIPARFELTRSGRRSLLTRLEDSEEATAAIWESLPGFQWYAPVFRARAGCDVLAVHRSEANSHGSLPLLVTRTFGTGKVLFMGTDGAWRWREGVEDRYHYRFWGQVARWMAYQRNMAQGESMRLFYSPDRPLAGHVVSFGANVMAPSGEPLSQGSVVVKAESPSGRTSLVRLKPGGDEWGLFTGTFTPEESGEHRLTLVCDENGSTVEAVLFVEGLARERIGQPARYEVLDEIATVTRGQRVAATELEALVTQVAALRSPEPVVRRLRVWSHPAWAGTIVLLLGVFWVARKMNGVI